MPIYDDEVPVQIRNKFTDYATKCLWCGGCLKGTAFSHQVPKFCGATHQRKYREHQRPTQRAPQPAQTYDRICRRCGQTYQTLSVLRSQMCSVVCILKDASYDLWNKCWRKRAWLMRAAAIQAAWRLGQNTGDHGTSPYHCEYCEYWHIGHRKQGVKQMTHSPVDTNPPTL